VIGKAFRELQYNNIPFVVLRSHEEVFSINDQDEIDIIVKESCLQSVLSLLKQQGFFIRRHIWPHVFAYCYDKNTNTIVKLDIVSCLAYGRFFRSRARNLEKALWKSIQMDQWVPIPSQEIKIAMLFLHCLLDKQGNVKEIYREDVARFNVESHNNSDTRKLIEMDFPVIARQLASGRYLENMNCRKLELLEAMHRKSSDKCLAIYSSFQRLFSRVSSKTYRGRKICMLGPDGSGKSSVSRELTRRRWVENSRCSIIYMGYRERILPIPYLLQLMMILGIPFFVCIYPNFIFQKLRRRLLGSHSEKLEEPLLWKAYFKNCFVMARCLDLLLRYCIKVLPQVYKGKNVILDRYFYDLLVADDDFDMGGVVPDGLLGHIVLSLIPQPDLTVCLINSPDVLFERCREHSPLMLKRMLNGFLNLKKYIPNFKTIQTDNTIHEIATEVLALLAGVEQGRKNQSRILSKYKLT
jgi:thymidylate kinase